jgi:SAM-dependent methyltransferase
MDSYDAIPYHSIPFTETHPVNLAVIGRLFGLATPDPDACRLVELGCASGGNLIPMAWHLPGSRFEGVDRSAAQAAAGAALVAELGLENVVVREGDILELGPGLGEVDYLVAHGVYSWVPAPVQERILALCAECLSPHGVAYVSYNTLPGWRMRGMLRDALLYHVRGASAPGDRLERARSLLERLRAAVEGLETVPARYLREEIDYLRGTHPSYLYHEYLAERNEPLLLTDFVARARAHGLQYLADTSLARMFPESLGEGGAALVAGLEDQVELEQYLDFAANRYFRQTVLCRARRAVERAIDLEGLDRLAVFSPLEPPAPLDLRAAGPVDFRHPDGRTLEVHHPLTRAALAALARVYPDSVALPELRAEAERQVAGAGAPALAGQGEHLSGEVFSLYAHAALGLDTRARAFGRLAGDRPRATRLARAQAARGLGHLATARHGSLSTDAFAARLVGYLDGATDRAALVARLTADAEEGRLALGTGARGPGPAPGRGSGPGQEPGPGRERGPGPGPGRGDLSPERVAANVDRLLALFARQGVLEAEAPASPGGVD